MVTREILKKEIDQVQERYLGVLFRILKTFEVPDDLFEVPGDLIKLEAEPQNDLVEFFESSPLYDLKIDLERSRDFGREVLEN